jgi:hypothetical protein
LSGGDPGSRLATKDFDTRELNEAKAPLEELAA